MLGVCNPEVDIRLLAEDLRTIGFTDVRTPVEAAIGLDAGGGGIDCYWLTSDLSIYQSEARDVASARALLGDASSVQIFDQVLNYRRTGEAASLPAVTPVSRQYLGDGLGFINGAVRLLDAGAYTGDTVRTFVTAGIDLVSVIALEPDPKNFALLAAELDDLPDVRSVALPIALSSSTGLVTFDADSTAAAHLSDGGECRVLAVAGDDVLHGWHPTHIKMDIEGSEPDALIGLRNTLRTERPALSISAYHQPQHHWSLLLWLDALGLDYSFHLGAYGQQTFDTVLYAIPKN
jgi:FkbM family methyltransferase